MSKPAVCARPSSCCHRSRNSSPRYRGARVRRIENTSITVRGDRTLHARPTKGPFPMQSRSDVVLLVVRPVRLQFLSVMDGNERPGRNNMLNYTTKSRLRHSRWTCLLTGSRLCSRLENSCLFVTSDTKAKRMQGKISVSGLYVQRQSRFIVCEKYIVCEIY